MYQSLMLRSIPKTVSDLCILFKKSVFMSLLYIQLYVLLQTYVICNALYTYTADTFILLRDIQKIGILIVLRTSKKPGCILTV